MNFLHQFIKAVIDRPVFSAFYAVKHPLPELKVEMMKNWLRVDMKKAF